MSDRRTTRVAWRAHPVQAVVEAGLLGLLLLAGVLSLHTALGPRMTEQGALSVAALAALWGALRARAHTGSIHWLHWLAREAVTALGLGGLWAAGWLVGARWLGWDAAVRGSTFGSAVSLVLVAGSVAGFSLLRLLVWLWRYWSGLRRRRLVWAMTHMQVQIVLLFALVGAALMLSVFVIEGNLLPQAAVGEGTAAVADGLIATVLPLLGIVIAMTAVVLVFVLPPTAVFAYFFSRRITNRFDALATAATILRPGDTGALVEVRGEDELAQLRADFNVMAADVEHLAGPRSWRAERRTGMALE